MSKILNLEWWASQFLGLKILTLIPLRLGLSTTLTSEDKNGDFETSLKVKNKDYILMYDGLGAKIENISTNEVIYPINHYFAL